MNSTRIPSAPFGRTAILHSIAAAVLSRLRRGRRRSRRGAGSFRQYGHRDRHGHGHQHGGTDTAITPVATETKVTLVLVDGSGNRVTSLSGGQSGTLKATVLTPSGRPAVGEVVKFAAGTAGLIKISRRPYSASTGADGVAVVTIKPAGYTAAGALALTATAEADSKTGTGGVDIAIGAAPLTVGTLSFTPAPNGVVPAFSTLSLNIPVTSNGKAADSIDGIDLELPVLRRRHRLPRAGRAQQRGSNS